VNGTTLASYTYDNYATTANVTQVNNAGVSQWQSYNSNDNVATSTDANGNVTAICYDSTNLYPVTQVVAASNPGCPTPVAKAEGRTTTFVRDFNGGVLTSATDADNSLTTSYTTTLAGKRRPPSREGV
jgi:YD repeat-containing protein